MRWMKLEPIIQSEVSQKEKHQYSILTHIWRRQWHPTLVCLPRKFHGQRSLPSYYLTSKLTKSLQMMITAMKLKDAYSLEGKL